MKYFFKPLVIALFFLSYSLSFAQNDMKNSSPYIKEAILSCLENNPKTTDTKTSREIVKKCLESKGIQAQKDTPKTPYPLREKQNEALKQCYSYIDSNDKKQIQECLVSKGIK